MIPGRPVPTAVEVAVSVAPLVPLPRPEPAAALPAPLTQLVGREREVAQLAALLRRDDTRLVTLTGPGGVGKTRLALAVAAEQAEIFADGVLFVPLAPVHEPALVVPTIAQALDVREAGERPLLERLAAALRERELLLVLDNFERVVDAAPALAELLAGCPGLTTLATSRARLRLRGERVLPVAPLPIPDVDHAPDPEAVRASPAVALFLQRGRDIRPDFALTPENAAVVAAICRRLEGLPLALELAAARLAILSAEELLVRLEHRLPLLTGGARDLPERLQTMRGAIAWSHDLLSAEEQALFRRLAVFVGGFALGAAEAGASAGGELGIDVLDGISSLVDAGLLHPTGGTGQPRFAMLETVREYALERLVASGGEPAVRRAQADWCLPLAERADRVFRRRVGQEPWLELIAAEHDNLRAALAWTLEHDPAVTLAMAGAMAWFWFVRGHLGEGQTWLERAMAAADGGGASAAGARALYARGMLAHYGGGDPRAVAWLEAGLAGYRALGDPWGVPASLLVLGIVAEDRGAYDDAAAKLEEALALFRADGDAANAALALNHLGVVAWGRGETGRALALCEEAATRQRAAGDGWGVANALAYVGLIAAERGGRARAAAAHHEALAWRWAAGATEDVAGSLADLAVLAAGGGQPELAARLLGAAEGAREAVGGLLKLPERAAYERAAAAARASLGDVAFAAAWAAGRALSLEEAVAAAQALAAGAPTTGQASAPPAVPDEAARYGLTPREVEVLRLLAEGRSDREIGAALFVSHRTAMKHVGNILAKLGVGSRAAAAALALREGLL